MRKVFFHHVLRFVDFTRSPEKFSLKKAQRTGDAGDFFSLLINRYVA